MYNDWRDSFYPYSINPNWRPINLQPNNNKNGLLYRNELSFSFLELYILIKEKINVSS